VRDVFIDHRPGLVGPERQLWLRSVKGENLTLLAGREHDRMARRCHVEADNVLELGQKLGIARALEAADGVRLQPVRGPDALCDSQGQPYRLGHRSAGPMRRLSRRLGATQRHQPPRGGIECARFTGVAGPVAQKAVDTGLGETPLATPDDRAADIHHMY
jgi:hypothetical protein